jgi:hypothetical protein
VSDPPDRQPRVTWGTARALDAGALADDAAGIRATGPAADLVRSRLAKRAQSVTAEREVASHRRSCP